MSVVPGVKGQLTKYLSLSALFFSQVRMKSFFTRPPPRARFSTPIETNERLRNGGGGGCGGRSRK